MKQYTTAAQHAKRHAKTGRETLEPQRSHGVSRTLDNPAHPRATPASYRQRYTTPSRPHPTAGQPSDARHPKFTQTNEQTVQTVADSGPCAKIKDPSTPPDGSAQDDRKDPAAVSGCAGPSPPWRRLDRNRGRPAAAALFAHCRSPSPTNATGVCLTAQPAYGPTHRTACLTARCSG